MSEDKANGGTDQQFRSVEEAIIRDMNDVIIIDRPVMQTGDVLSQLQRYSKLSWAALNSRLGQEIIL